MVNVLVCSWVHRQCRVYGRMARLMVGGLASFLAHTIKLLIIKISPSPSIFSFSHIRIPFYYFVKTLLLLYLVLPQTQGSSYIYVYHLQPFFHSHESEIDAGIASLKIRALEFIQQRLKMLWDLALAAIGQQATGAATAPAQGNEAATGGAPPPSTQNPLAGPSQLLGSFLGSYGPTLLAGGAALLHQTQTAAANAAANARAVQAKARANNYTASGSSASVSGSYSGSSLRPSAASGQHQQQPPVGAPPRFDSAESIRERRRQLEAELAALASHEDAFDGGSRASSSVELRSRSGRGGDDGGSGRMHFEEVEVPSDVEGYLSNDDGEERPRPMQRTSWFGWASPSKSGGYERVKSD
jgi:receptor expression-enhancing protein 1/2/3/4